MRGSQIDEFEWHVLKFHLTLQGSRLVFLHRHLKLQNTCLSLQTDCKTFLPWSLWNHRMVSVGKSLKDHLGPAPPAMGRATFLHRRLLKAPSNMAVNTTTNGAFITSLGNLFQCFTTLNTKNFFLKSNVNPPFFSLRSLVLVLSLHAFEKSPSPALLHAPLSTERLLKGVPGAYSYLGWTTPTLIISVLYSEYFSYL